MLRDLHGQRNDGQTAPLTIEPKPTPSFVFLWFTALDKPIKVSGYAIRTPKRTGFTVMNGRRASLIMNHENSISLSPASVSWPWPGFWGIYSFN